MLNDGKFFKIKALEKKIPLCNRMCKNLIDLKNNINQTYGDRRKKMIILSILHILAYSRNISGIGNMP